MIKNIMENIGRKEAAENYGKLIDRREELFAKKERREKLSPEEVDELKDLTEKIQHYLFSMLGKKKENPAEVEEKEEVKEDMENVGKKPKSNPPLEEVIKAKNDRIAELSKAHPNEWAMNGHNTDFDRIVENDPVMKKLDSFRF